MQFVYRVIRIQYTVKFHLTGQPVELNNYNTAGVQCMQLMLKRQSLQTSIVFDNRNLIVISSGLRVRNSVHDCTTVIS